MGSFDTDAFGVLLRMKSKVGQTLNNSFLLSSQPQAGVSKHPKQLLMPLFNSLFYQWRRADGSAASAVHACTAGPDALPRAAS